MMFKSLLFSMLAILGFASVAMADEVYVSRGYAIKGYDPVAYFTLGKPTKGDEAYSAEYKGATWLFVNAKHQKMFKENPEKYAPQYGGYCAYAAGKGNGKLVRINPKAFEVYNDKLYLNFSPAIQEDWAKSKGFFIERADRNYPKLKK